MSNLTFYGIATEYFEAYMVVTMCRVTVRQEEVVAQYIGFVMEVRVVVLGKVLSNWGLCD
jgi:hypothetical protein